MLLSLRTILFLGILLFLGVTVRGMHRADSIQAKSGDGIYSLLRKSGLLSIENYNAFVELNANRLLKGNALEAGVYYFLPSKYKRNTLHESLLGKTYSKVTTVSNDLHGAIFYLVSGHGGPDPGAMGMYKGSILCEDEYAYDVTLRLARNLLSHNAKVYIITRDSNDGIRDAEVLLPDHDEYCYLKQKIPLNQEARLEQRVQTINRLYAEHKGNYQRFIEIHIDSRGNNKDIDVFFYYDERSNNGKQTALQLLQVFDEKYKQYQPMRGYNGSTSARSLYMVKNTYAPCVFIELGNINHQRDQQRFLRPANRQALANWLTEGLLLNYKASKRGVITAK